MKWLNDLSEHVSAVAKARDRAAEHQRILFEPQRTLDALTAFERTGGASVIMGGEPEPLAEHLLASYLAWREQMGYPPHAGGDPHRVAEQAAGDHDDLRSRLWKHLRDMELALARLVREKRAIGNLVWIEAELVEAIGRGDRWLPAESLVIHVDQLPGGHPLRQQPTVELYPAANGGCLVLGRPPARQWYALEYIRAQTQAAHKMRREKQATAAADDRERAEEATLVRLREMGKPTVQF